MNKSYKISMTIILFSIVLLILLYFLNFKDIPISKDTSSWGAFGDYFGGVLNPIIGIINIAILINITFQISKIDGDRIKSELEIQKQIALFALKHDALKALKQILEKFQPELVKSDENSALNIILYRNEFNSYIDTYLYLFPFFEKESWKPLKDNMITLSEIADQRFIKKNDLDIENVLKPYLIEFNNLKGDFIKEVQEKILII
jgi:hypothetical protein